ncbi:hypothetical protein A3860_07770 [Niastella vici]|uniref:Secretion system C-terminal sorting domain-containing protein n=1 Tax=Niastella vici TaxID=1703345 RepID=A0A1V9FIM0_9BACT|nr:T9SS type A sorting domain-containing protein [Niastella vici]OQP58213.1 hypothetical protein A3860_07770 [Niastella vici]
MKKHLLTVFGIIAMATVCQTSTWGQVKGPSSSQTPYVVPVKTGVKTTAILTTLDMAGSYKMVGTPDGLGAFDNGDGTFTVLMNHEFGNTAGVVRAHGSKGAFVSKWIVKKSDLSVVSGSDLMKTVKLWNGTSYTTYNTASPMPAGFARFCSADLPAVSAFYNAATGKGTTERIFMNGEENGNEGRAMAHIVTGPNGGTSYELPYLGKFSMENSVANPATGDKTVVAGMDDATPGQVYFYIGTKTTTGTEIEKAGLTNGNLYAPAVSGMLIETSAGTPAAGTPFTMINLGDVHNMSGTNLNTASNNAGVTQFLRPEDGAWDPLHPEDFYFATTNAFGSPSRLWKLHFSNINDLTQGGTVAAVLDGTEGQQMFDNITIDHWGHILLVEDVGNNAHLGKTWQYTIATDKLEMIGTHDATRFLSGGANFLTQDEEASGILDVQEILGAGMFLLVDQAHYGITGEAVEGGQFLALFNPDTYAACSNYTGTISVNPSPAVEGQTPNTIFLGYGPQSLQLTASVAAGFPPYTYWWSTGATSNMISVSPDTTTTYTVIIKNAFGCADTVKQTVYVKDIRDGQKNKVFICHNGHTQSVSVNAVPAHLGHKDLLGACPDNARVSTVNNEQPITAALYPNPTHTNATIALELFHDEKVSITVVNIDGKVVLKQMDKNLRAGKQQISLSVGSLKDGTYFVLVSHGATTSRLKMVVLH